MPSESEWEYAARARTTGDFYENLDLVAWYVSNSGDKTHPVGQRHPNNFGLYDMSGNVLEWCEDLFYNDYDGVPNDGSANSKKMVKDFRISRGASWLNNAKELRSANRFWLLPSFRNTNTGFRVVVNAK